MKISAATKISTLIKANAASIDVIASINKHFEKLKNPILRRVLAPRVTIADAARIGNCTVELFFEKLIPLGFEVETPIQPKNSTTTTNLSLSEFFGDSKNSPITELDVRNEIASGRDPFSIIMETIEKLPVNNIILLINSFEPVPLIKILTKRGFIHFVETKSDGTVLTYLKKTKFVDSNPLNQNQNSIGNDFENKIREFHDRMKTIDVRQMEMPLPMVTILQSLETLPTHHALFVHHKKIPQFLFPELKEKKFSWSINEKQDGTVDLIIYKE